MKELNVDFDHDTHIGNSSPPMVYRDTVIIPPAGEEGFTPVSMRNTPGYVMAFDARSGKQKWVFHTIPKAGEFGADTWEGKSNEYTGNTGVWAPISVDPELGYAYLPVETPTNDYYGGHRLGSNLFGNSVVCVDLETGKRIWHYQITHHDIWNYDLPSAPTLVNMTVDGRPVKALVQLTKQGYAYVLDRVTGQPVWPFEERPAPASDVPGERAWPTQPHPTKPPAYEYQGYVENDLIDFTPELRAEAIKTASRYRLGPCSPRPPRSNRMAPRAPGTIPVEPAARSGRAAASTPRRLLLHSIEDRSRHHIGRQRSEVRPEVLARTGRRSIGQRTADSEAALQPDHGGRPQQGRIRLGDAARNHARAGVTTCRAQGQGSAEHWRHQPACHAAGHQDLADCRRRMGRRSGRARL